MRLGLTVLLSCLIAQPVEARDFYYFNRPNVTREQYVADKSECDRLMGGVTIASRYVYMPQNSSLTATQNAAAAGIAALFAGMVAGGERRRTMLFVERTCMADKGYARFQVDKDTLRAIEKLNDDQARLDRYFELAATNEPVGERIKE